MPRDAEDIGPRLLLGAGVVLLCVVIVCLSTYIGFSVGARMADAMPVKDPDASDADPAGFLWIMGGTFLGFALGLVACLGAESYRRRHRSD